MNDELFDFSTNPNRKEVRFWIPMKKGEENKRMIFFLDQEREYKGDATKEFIKRKISLVNYDFLEMSKAFHDGRMYAHVKTDAVRKYYDRVCENINEEFYLHAKATGTFQGLYAIYCGEPEKVYVGSVFEWGRTFCDRWREHIYHLKRGGHHSDRMQKAYNKTKTFIPMIVMAYNSCHVKSDIAETEIKSGERMLINHLWQNNYNHRKY